METYYIGSPNHNLVNMILVNCSEILLANWSLKDLCINLKEKWYPLVFFMCDAVYYPYDLWIFLNAMHLRTDIFWVGLYVKRCKINEQFVHVGIYLL